MRETLKPHIHTPRDLDELRNLVVAAGRFLSTIYPHQPIEYIGGPITADGPDRILDNLALLKQVADSVRRRDGVFTYTNPYVGDLRRFTGMGEREFSAYSTDLIRSGIFHRITFIEGWQRSKGCNDEYGVALALGIPVREVNKVFSGQL